MRLYYAVVLVCVCILIIVSLLTTRDSFQSDNVVMEYGNSLDVICAVGDGTENSTNLAIFKNDKIVPSEFIDVINSTTIRLHIEKPAKTFGDVYLCKQDGDTIWRKNFVIGTRPQDVTDFDCISNNFDNLTCTWTAPENYVTTTYSLGFSVGGRPSQQNNIYASFRYLLKCPKIKNEANNRHRCFWNVSTTPAYRQDHEVYVFHLRMTNALGTNFFTKKFHHFAHVLSGPPENLTVLSTTSTSVLLHWRVPGSMQSFPPGVHHRVLYHCEFDYERWHALIVDSQTRKDATFNLTNLHPYALCDIRVSLRSASSNDDSLWSRNSTITVRTRSQRPSAPPRTNQGAFEIVDIPNDTEVCTLYIYWIEIEDQEKNGPNVTYKILEVDRAVAPIEVTNTYAKFQHVSLLESYTFYIWSQNQNGSSIDNSTLHIPKRSDLLKKPRSLAVVEVKPKYENERKYVLTWEPPFNQSVTRYTIFYCESDKPHQCISFRWVEVGRGTSVILIIYISGYMKDYRLAVSTNTHDSSSGMLWATCTASLIDSHVLKLKSVWIERVGSTFIEVRWTLDCIERAGASQGYRIEYCPVMSLSHPECQSPWNNREYDGDGTRSGTIEGLRPNTTYMLTVTKIAKFKELVQKSGDLFATTRVADD